MLFSSTYLARSKPWERQKCLHLCYKLLPQRNCKESLRHKLGGVSTPGGFPVRKRKGSMY